MGLDNRDYARHSESSWAPSGGGGFGGGGYGSSYGAMVKKIMIATVVVFLLQWLTQYQVTDADGRPIGVRQADGRVVKLMASPVTDFFAVDYLKITRQGQIWRLLTYAFCHDVRGLQHILFNMIALWFFGREIEALYGSKEFTWFYGVTAVFAAMCYLIVGFTLEAAVGKPMGMMLGASGATVALTILFALHYPRRKIYIWGIIGVEARWIAAALVLFDAYPLLAEFMRFGLPEVGGKNVAHATHLGGALFAYIYFKRQFRLSNLVNGVGLGTAKAKVTAAKQRVKAAKSGLRVFKPEDEQVAPEELDRILEKISQVGEANLTDDERALLTRASKQYKNR